MELGSSKGRPLHLGLLLQGLPEGCQNSDSPSDQAICTTAAPWSCRSCTRCSGVFGLFAGTATREGSKDVEIAVLRYQVKVLRRQVARPSFRPIDRVFLAAASRVLPRDRGPRSSSARRPCSGGTASLSGGSGRTVPARKPGRPPTSGGGPHALAFAALYPKRVQAATVTVGGAPLLIEDTSD